MLVLLCVYFFVLIIKVNCVFMDVLEFVVSSHVCDATPHLALVDQFAYTSLAQPGSTTV